MSQSYLDEFDDEWDDFTQSAQDQLFEKLENVESAAYKNNDEHMTDNENSFPLSSKAAFDIFLDELLDLPPIKTKPKKNKIQQSKIPLSDISNRQQQQPLKLPLKDKQRDLKEKAPAPPAAPATLTRMESLDDGIWSELDANFLQLIEDESNNKSKVNGNRSSLDDIFMLEHQNNQRNCIPGFSTGRGGFNNISISPAAAENNNHTSKQSVDDLFIAKYSNKNNYIPCFSNGSGKNLDAPSEAAKLKAAKLLESVDKVSPSPIPDVDCNDNDIAADHINIIKDTEDNNKYTVSESHHNHDNISKDNSNIDALSKIEGFQTGRGMKLKPVSEEAKRRAMALFEDTDEDTKQQQTRPTTSSFATASGTRIKPVSEEAKQKALSLFKDLDETPEPSLPPQAKFTKASGMSMNGPSEKGKQSAALLFKESASEDLGNKKRSVNGNFKYDEAINLHGVFQMFGSKNDFEVSSQAKRKAMSILDDSEPIKKKQSIAPRSPTPIISRSPSPQVSVNRSMKSDVNTPYKPVSTSLPKRNNNRLSAIKKHNKPFKSPVIKSKYELTRAAISNPNTTKARAQPVFDLTAPSNRYKLSSLGKPLQYTKCQLVARNIPIAIINMTASNAKLYLFDRNWGPKEAQRALINAGTVPNRASYAWVENHYGWIVWKIACLIRSYPDKFMGHWNSAKVLEQLLYRYEREINEGNRPVLRKLLEHDDNSVKNMILLISDIVEIKNPVHFNTSSKYRLQLTDGWYQVPACIDLRMERAIIKKKLKIGSKLSICGAKIIGDLEARSPLEISNNSTMLSITTNGCLPARWDTKLGYHPRKLIIRSIPTIFDDGGTVTALDIVVCRKFPILYSETLPNGSVITRTAKEEVEARRTALGYDQYGEGLHRQQSLVSFNFRENQRTSNTPHLDRTVSEPPKNLEDRRVSGYFKIRICDATSSNTNQQLATLLLSNANELNHIDIVEGNRYKIFFVMPYHPKIKKYPGLDLKTTRMTRWEPAPASNLENAYVPRFLSVCCEIRYKDPLSDFDLVVLVLHTGTATLEILNGRKLYHQTLLVTDESQSICQINFRLPLSPFPDIKGQVLGLVNLRFEMYDSKFDITCLKATDETKTVSKVSSSAEYLQKGIQRLKSWVNDNPADVKSVTNRIHTLVQ